MRQTAIMLVLLCLAVAGCRVSEENQSLDAGQLTITGRTVGPGDTDVEFDRKVVYELCELYSAAINMDSWPPEVAQAQLARANEARTSILRLGPDTAAAALEQILSESEPTSRLRIFAAFALAYTGIDYERGREVLLRFLAATNPDADSNLRAEVQALHPPYDRDLPACGGEDVAILVWRLFEQTHDEVLLHRLEEARQWSDGALAEVLYSLESRIHPYEEPTE